MLDALLGRRLIDIVLTHALSVLWRMAVDRVLVWWR